MTTTKRKIVLVIRDGWGENHNHDQDKYNAIRLAKTPVSDALTANAPRTELAAHGLDVGLPQGVMGNSEVGHQNIGAGRVVDQELVRITKAFATGELKNNTTLNQVFRKKRVHLLGLLSDAGVHATVEHLYGLLQLAANSPTPPEVFIHAFLDGRDRPPKSAGDYIRQLENKIKDIGIGKIATLCGRYYAMDRDQRWERTQSTYNLLTIGAARYQSDNPHEILEEFYKDNDSDEFFPSALIHPKGTIKDGDAVIFTNFRGDRPRQLTRVFTEPNFTGFPRHIRDILFATMTEYQEGLCQSVIFPKPEKMPDILGEVLFHAGLKQFRCAETEKYPHVTFFFNDYREQPFPGEVRSLVPSPRDVPTYDLKPEMSAEAITDSAVQAIQSEQYHLVVINFANADMVGHTGNQAACIRAVETVDACLSKILNAVDQTNAIAVVTSDHGNADILWNEEIAQPHTQHTLNPVELTLYGKDIPQNLKLKPGGKLGNIAPTILELIGLDIPEHMLNSLIES